VIRLFVLAGLALAFAVLAAATPCDTGPKAIQEWKGVDARHPSFHTPVVMTVDPSGNVYLLDQRDYRILQFSPEGVFQKSWEVPGEGRDPNGDERGLFLFSLAASDSFIYVASEAVTFKLYRDGSVAQWNFGACRNGLAVDHSGHLFVSTSPAGWLGMDWGPPVMRESRQAPEIKQRLDVLRGKERAGIWKLSSEGETLAHWEAPPWPITVSKSGSIYAVEPDSGGAILHISGKMSNLKECQLKLEPTLPNRSLAVSPAGSFLVNDHKAVVEFDESGKVLRRWCDPGPQYDLIDAPANLSVDAEGHLYVVDYFKSRVLKFDLTAP
jgi:sugar lactone lactonase YvrE